jgi:ligand-binding SRPBCC domain-containing protein
MTEIFERSVHLPVNAEQAFAWHERPGALDRLLPPWESLTVDKREHGIGDGSMVELTQQIVAVKFKWVAKHYDYQPSRSFRDTQVTGPFASWEHLHDFRPNGDRNGALTDHIE